MPCLEIFKKNMKKLKYTVYKAQHHNICGMWGTACQLLFLWLVMNCAASEFNPTQLKILSSSLIKMTVPDDDIYHVMGCPMVDANWPPFHLSFAQMKRFPPSSDGACHYLIQQIKELSLVTLSPHAASRSSAIIIISPFIQLPAKQPI